MEKDSAKEKQFQRMTTQPVGKLLLTLSVPTVISMMVTNIYNIVDTAFVGILGTSESGATGIVFGYMAILQALAFMCGQGAGSIMSRKLGQKDQAGATRYTSTGFYLSFGLGALVAILSGLFMNPVLSVLGSTETIAPFAGIYISFIVISAPFFTSSLTLNNLLRYEGKAKLGTVGMMTGAVLNICGDAIFMFGLHMGIAGAGLSTALSQFISFCILLSMFLRGKTQTEISLKHMAKDAHTFFNVMATGFPSLLRQGLNSVATMLLNNAAGVYGDEAVAAMSIVSRISFFPMAVAIGIGQGFQPISGFNFGAGKKDRVRKAFWTAVFGEELVLMLISIPIYIYAGNLIRVMRNDSEVILVGIRALHLMCIAQIFVPMTMMVEMGFQSIGEKFLASLGSSLRSGLILIPSLILLSKYRGLYGIQEAQPISIVVTFMISIVLCNIYLKRLKM